MKRVLWLLNFDAEFELAAPDDYVASTKMRSNMADLVERFVRPSDEESFVLQPGEPLPDALVEARAWCLTPTALKTLTAAGFAALRSPSLAILQSVNHRAFAGKIGPSLPGAFFSTNVEEVRERLASGEVGKSWLLKRPYGFSARLRKRVLTGRLAEAEQRWIAASMEAYGIGLQVEPFVNVLADFALHGLVRADGSFALGTPTRQLIDDNGAWHASRRIEKAELRRDEEDALLGAGERVGRALASKDYFGPFNIDAYRWRDQSGADQFHPLSEINARYSMGWYIGMSSSL